MRHCVKVFSVLSASTLMGCSQFALAPTDTSPKVQSLERITSPVSEVEGMFILGREAHGNRQMVLAEARYARVLILQPEHVGALNAMAVIYAQTQRTDQAYALFQRALAVDTNAAHVRNNLGYALMRAGRLDEAQDQFNQAQILNPDSELIRQNQAKLAQLKGPRLALATPKPAGPQLVPVQPHVYELREAVVQPLPVVLNGLQSGVKIEISNGVGIPNLARRTARRLAPMGVVTARLTNQPGYKQMTTEIHYSPGQLEAAQALSAKLPMEAQVLAAQDLGTRVQMRLVLGRDLDESALSAWLDEQPEPAVAMSPAESGYQ